MSEAVKGRLIDCCVSICYLYYALKVCTLFVKKKYMLLRV